MKNKNPIKLKKGSSRKTISENIAKLIHHGYATDQAIAYAFDAAGLSYRKAGTRMNPAEDQNPTFSLDSVKNFFKKLYDNSKKEKHWINDVLLAIYETVDVLDGKSINSKRVAGLEAAIHLLTDAKEALETGKIIKKNPSTEIVPATEIYEAFLPYVKQALKEQSNLFFEFQSDGLEILPSNKEDYGIVWDGSKIDFDAAKKASSLVRRGDEVFLDVYEVDENEDMDNLTFWTYDTKTKKVSL